MFDLNIPSKTATKINAGYTVHSKITITDLSHRDADSEHTVQSHSNNLNQKCHPY